MKSGAKPILLVEDNPDDQLLTMRALRKHQVDNDVVVVRDGVEALDYLFATGAFAARDPAASPALVLLDLNLPRMGGHEVLRRLRADPRTALQIVVVLTTSTEERDVQTSYQLGANSYVRKPVDYQHFSQLVGELNQYWLQRNVPPPGNA